MIRSTPKPHFVLTIIAASICAQQCGAFCAKQQIAPRVDMQIKDRQFFDEKGKAYFQKVIPYKYVLEVCRKIHTENNSNSREKSPQEIPARHSSPDSTLALSTSSTNSIVESYSPMLLEAISLSQQSCTPTESERSNEHTEDHYTHIPIPRLIELRKILIPLITIEKLMRIIESYVPEAKVTDDWLEKNVIRLNIPKLTKAESSCRHYLIFHHETETSLYDCEKQELVFEQKKQELPAQADMKKNQELSISLPTYDEEVLAEQKVLDDLKASDKNISSIENIPGGFIAIGYKNGELEIRKAQTEHTQNSKKMSAFFSSITALHMLPSGYLAAGSKEDGSIQLWNPYTGYFVSDLPGLQLPNLIRKHAGISQLLSQGNMLIVIFDTSDEGPQKQSVVMYKNYLT